MFQLWLQTATLCLHVTLLHRVLPVVQTAARWEDGPSKKAETVCTIVNKITFLPVDI